MILDCLHSDAEFPVVSCQDKDVFLLSVSHFEKISFKQLLMRAGTYKKTISIYQFTRFVRI